MKHKLPLLAVSALLLLVPCATAQTTTISFEPGEGYSTGNSGSTLQAVNSSVLGTFIAVPDSASILGTGITGSQSLTVTKESDYVTIFANNSAGATSFSFSLQVQPGNDWAGASIGFGTDAQITVRDTNATGTTQSTIFAGVNFSGNGNSASLQTVSTMLAGAGSWTNTGTAYTPGATYTVAGTIDFGVGQTTLSVTQGATTIYSGSTSSSYAGTNFLIFLTGGGQYGSLHAVYDNVQMSAVPEPSTYAALAGVGAFGMAVWRRRRGAARK